MINIETFDFKDKRVLVRVDFNVPLNDRLQVTDDTRIRAVLPTLNKVLDGGGSLVLMSHLGRPKNGPEHKFSLKPVATRLGELMVQGVHFHNDCVGKEAIKKAEDLRQGEVILMENLRFYKEETSGDLTFAKQLSELGDVYVNDAFGTAHRAHASTAIIAQFFPANKLFGCLINSEIKSVSKVLNEGKNPITAVIGGAKVSSKISIIERLLDKVDNLIIGGGMAFTFTKAQEGGVGASLVEEDKLDLALNIIALAKKKGVNLFLPEDSTIADKFDNNANKKTCNTHQIPEGWMGLDIGPEAIKTYAEVLKNSQTILWNGPMGVFELSNFEQGTKAVGLAISEATDNGAFSLIGGGDSVAAVNKYNLKSRVSYVSTGGGAMLEYLEGKELPGIMAILH